MGDRAPADPVKFKEASDWFRAKLPVTQEEWNTMRTEARRQAFTVAGVQQLEAVETVMSLIQQSIDKGTSIDEFRAQVKEKLGAKFGATGANLTTAFINAHQTAYNTGRYEQMMLSVNTLNYWVFDAVLDDRTSAACTECARTTLPATDGWWNTHFPPLHHRCRSTVRALTERMAKKRGISAQGPRPKITGDWGLAPPLRGTWEPDLNNYDSHLAREYLQKQKNLKAANDNGDPLPRPKRK